MRTAVITWLAFLVVGACSSSSDCPTYAPGIGQACAGSGTCSYGILSCSCEQQTWQCTLPFSPDLSDGGGDEEAGLGE
ncbi:MAG: hypothetical protein ABSC94_00500 [Polyangiaceae bacterium]